MLQPASAAPNVDHNLKISDAVWIAAALLHRTSPETQKFSTETIVEEVLKLRLTNAERRSVWQHVNQHCVANRAPMPNRSRMLLALGKGERRLYKPGDSYHKGRLDAPEHPEWDVLPPEFQYLKTWYEKDWARAVEEDLLVLLAGSWKYGEGDTYVNQLREGWE